MFYYKTWYWILYFDMNFGEKQHAIGINMFLSLYRISELVTYQRSYWFYLLLLLSCLIWFVPAIGLSSYCKQYIIQIYIVLAKQYIFDLKVMYKLSSTELKSFLKSDVKQWWLTPQSRLLHLYRGWLNTLNAHTDYTSLR